MKFFVSSVVIVIALFSVPATTQPSESRAPQVRPVPRLRSMANSSLRRMRNLAA